MTQLITQHSSLFSCNAVEAVSNWGWFEVGESSHGWLVVVVGDIWRRFFLNVVGSGGVVEPVEFALGGLVVLSP
mgnify:CR=1 FL=1